VQLLIILLHPCNHYFINSTELCPEVSDQPYRVKQEYDRTIGGKTRFSCLHGFIMIGVPELRCKPNDE